MPGAFPTHLSSHRVFKAPCPVHMRLATGHKHVTNHRKPSSGFERKRNGLWATDHRMCQHKHWRVNCSNYEPFPFDDDNYFRVFLQMIVRDANDNIATGTLVLLKEQLSASSLADLSLKEGDVQGLAIQVGGDTLQSISNLASGSEALRPNALNLMHQIMEELQKKKGNKWKLLKVGIVDYRDGIFYGRLFFGDPDTNEVAWDCDCRPSDGCWLSLKTQCPLYLHRKVWDDCAGPLGMGTLQEGVTDFEGETEEVRGDPLTSIMPGDLEVIRRLKREMSVAVAEEDYETAKRLRDHPYMQKYKLMQEHKDAGRHVDAAEALQSLVKEIEENEERPAGHED